MTVRRRVAFGIGKRVVQKSAPGYPNEARWTKSVREQTKSMEDALVKILKSFEEVSEEVIIEALKPTMEKAKTYTPKDTGALVNSAYLEKVMFRGKPKVEFGFARGGVPPYATEVHENLAFQHAVPTQAKFLEVAVQEDLVNIYRRLAYYYKYAVFG